MATRMRRKNIYLPERESRLLEKEAEKLRVSQGEVVRRLIAEALEGDSKDDPMLRFIGSASWPTKGARYVDDIYRT